MISLRLFFKQPNHIHQANFLTLSLVTTLMIFSSVCVAQNLMPHLSKEEIAKVKSFPYDNDKGQVSYGSRLYKNNCQSCHGPIGVSYLNQLAIPRILGLSGQQMVDSLVYYRDAESHGILLKGNALLMSRQALFLNDDEINSIARYFEELNPVSDLNIAKEKAQQEERRKRKRVRISDEEIERLQNASQ